MRGTDQPAEGGGMNTGWLPRTLLLQQRTGRRLHPRRRPVRRAKDSLRAWTPRRYHARESRRARWRGYPICM